MINFTDSLYRVQWLDLVFKNRNKSYGAYALRLENDRTTVKALFSACLLFSLLILLPWILRTPPPIIYDNSPDLPLDQLVEVNIPKMSKPEPPAPPAAKSEQPVPVKTVQLTANMKVAPAEMANFELPTVDDIAISTVGTSNADGVAVTGNASPAVENPGNGTTEAPASENTVYDLPSLEIYPEFPGGQEAFMKFISRNIRYPMQASESGIQGTVIVRFIIERNGSLSDIKILRSVGGGCDEEAMRVLRKSPAWKPGQQNNQAVRVAYTLPLTFKLS